MGHVARSKKQYHGKSITYHVKNLQHIPKRCMGFKFFTKCYFRFPVSLVITHLTCTTWNNPLPVEFTPCCVTAFTRSSVRLSLRSGLIQNSLKSRAVFLVTSVRFELGPIGFVILLFIFQTCLLKM